MAKIKPQEIDEFISSGRRMYEGGLATGALGAAGSRLPDGSIVLTAAGTRMGFMRPEDLLVLNTAAPPQNGREPGLDSGIIRAVLVAQPEAGAVIRVNSPYTTALAHGGRKMLDRRAELLRELGGVSFVPFYRPGTAGLAGAVAEVMRACRIALIEGQGAVVRGTDLADAIDTAEALEAAARVIFILEGSGVS